LAEDKHSKTEKPSPRRKKKAREDGQIPRSPEIVAWTTVLIATMVIPWALGHVAAFMRSLMFEVANLIAHPDMGAGLRLFGDALWRGLLTIAPIVFMGMAVGVAGNVAQVGWAPTLKPLKPKFNRLNPLPGLKRLFSPTNFWRGARDVFKVAVIAFLGWTAIKDVAPALAGGGLRSISSVLSIVGGTALSFIRNVAVVGIILAFVDYAVNRKDMMKNLRMSKQELKEEHKQAEGDPHVKGQIKGKMMRMSRMRMMAAVADADAVITNPTRYAVAISYDITKASAPRVVAKGLGVIAEKIRWEAAKHDVPVVEEPPLARTLYRLVDIEDTIPPMLFAAVAKLLAFVYSLEAMGKKRSGVHTMPFEVFTAEDEAAATTRRRAEPPSETAHRDASSSAAG